MQTQTSGPDLWKLAEQIEGLAYWHMENGRIAQSTRAFQAAKEAGERAISLDSLNKQLDGDKLSTIG